MTDNDDTDTLIQHHIADLDGIIVTALEGGIGYWSVCRKYRNAAFDDPQNHPEGCWAEIREDDQETATSPGWHRVDRQTVARGLQVCSRKYPHVFSAYLASDEQGFRSVDAGEADVIVQCGIFGEAVYG